MSIMAHNCVIEDSVVISNAVALAGHVHIESRAVIGGMVGIHQFVHIGRLMLGAMSRIDRDVPPYMLVEKSGTGAIAKPRGTERRAGMADQEKCSQPSKSFPFFTALAYR